MTSVERINEYTQIQSEQSLHGESKIEPPQNWPSTGKLEFQNVTLQYKSDNPPVLKNISFVFKEGEKVTDKRGKKNK